MNTYHKIYDMQFSKIYVALINKAVKKGRTKEEVDEVICWLTGYSLRELQKMSQEIITYGDFFKNAPKPNKHRHQIKGNICGVKIEEIKEPLMREIRYLDKLIDELAKGKFMKDIKRT